MKIPFDVVTNLKEVKPPNKLTNKDVIVDMGPETLEDLKNTISKSKTILWNGPLGVYEDGFDQSSKEILTAVTQSGAFSVVGGGDTVKLIKEMGLEEKISFVSTGGGAMLEFLSSGTLAGIEALNL
ncbi:MAG: phosphoglycerate kinase [Candidatus Paceibacterota bacterium]